MPLLDSVGGEMSSIQHVPVGVVLDNDDDLHEGDDSVNTPDGVQPITEDDLEDTEPLDDDDDDE